ncbi:MULTISPECIES: DUF202 domain-containing protein [Rhodococcus]|uniref:Uncharacterized protein n=1 Tax=Rhodococcus opacus TaxID=37919 RepID=A0A1B1K136_RHOOP|nr:DUF202 domain-containing protein [Rhodococcus opacus]ELB87934.1 hypothetical protein Rwratislav_37232 [Rhodococcus wratislaviensis IFP 2016]NHU47339.1 DUF202 domain-containing protein [Rhodococcus sp. A14]ANS26319.1 hypothetical protein R1CP_07990 [Rhodococcus opacus]MDX5969818.1 DUF202 domain-containing protein [Rhodococcus opacus]NKY69924.1 DUF202 domain-containing protein [Rhodococcus opacus]
MLTGRLLPHRRRKEPAVDVGLQAERTAMAWQRTALGVGGVSALLLHLAAGNLPAAVPGLAGLSAALLLLVLSEQRYVRIVNKVGAGEPPPAPGLVRLIAAGAVVLAVSALALLLLTDA